MNSTYTRPSQKTYSPEERESRRAMINRFIYIDDEEEDQPSFASRLGSQVAALPSQVNSAFAASSSSLREALTLMRNAQQVATSGQEEMSDAASISSESTTSSTSSMLNAISSIFSRSASSSCPSSSASTIPSSSPKSRPTSARRQYVTIKEGTYTRVYTAHQVEDEPSDSRTSPSPAVASLKRLNTAVSLSVDSSSEYISFSAPPPSSSSSSFRFW